MLSALTGTFITYCHHYYFTQHENINNAPHNICVCVCVCVTLSNLSVHQRRCVRFRVFGALKAVALLHTLSLYSRCIARILPR